MQDKLDPALLQQQNSLEETNINKTSLMSQNIQLCIPIQRGKEFQRTTLEGLEMSHMGNNNPARQNKKCKLESDI